MLSAELSIQGGSHAVTAGSRVRGEVSLALFAARRRNLCEKIIRKEPMIKNKNKREAQEGMKQEEPMNFFACPQERNYRKSYGC